MKTDKTGMTKIRKEQLYIAYGSNLNRIQMSIRCPTAKVVGPAVLRGWRLMFRGSDGNAVATIERYSGHTVPVLVWRLQQKDELALDRYEGWPYLYRKQILRITQNGRRFYAMVYIMNEDNHPYGTPSDYYLGMIQRGYEYSGFDKSILQQAAIDSSRAVGMINNPQAEKR